MDTKGHDNSSSWEIMKVFKTFGKTEEEINKQIRLLKNKVREFSFTITDQRCVVCCVCMLVITLIVVAFLWSTSQYPFSYSMSNISVIVVCMEC